MNSEESDKYYYGNPENLLPVRRKDDRRLPGIIVGWTTEFSEKYFAWRVWDGTVQRENDPDKEEIYGYWDCGTHQQVDQSSAICIVYPADKPECEFIEWANSESLVAFDGKFFE